VEYLLLVLYVAGLALVYQGQRKAEQRAKEFEAELRGRDEQAAVLERLDELEQLLRQMDPEPTRAEVNRLRAAVAQLLEPPAAPEPLPDANEISRVQEVKQLVHRHLRRSGCDQIHILDEDQDLDGDELEVRIEAMRDGLCIKGRLQVVGNDVREIGLDDTHKLFP
jgi:hypothetical protein